MHPFGCCRCTNEKEKVSKNEKQKKTKNCFVQIILLESCRQILEISSAAVIVKAEAVAVARIYMAYICTH